MNTQPTICIKSNNTITNDPCALCGQRTDPQGVDLFLEDTWMLVCTECGAKHDPKLVKLCELWSQLEAGVIGAEGAEPQQITTDEYFGGCPHCGKSNIVNVHKSHYGICEEHKVFWPAGYNLFSSWQHEDGELWAKHDQMLARFAEVEPIRPAADELPLLDSARTALAAALDDFLRAYARPDYPLAAIVKNQAEGLRKSLAMWEPTLCATTVEEGAAATTDPAWSLPF